MDFKLPDIGEGVAEGEITKWLVATGDSLELDQPMVEVMTDKATVEIPSPAKGVVSELLAKEGETVEVGKVILRIGESGAGGGSNGGSPEVKAQAPSHSTPEVPAGVTQQTAVVEKEGEVLPFKVLATPATRKLARDLKIDLSTVPGTGPNGRVTKSDVEMAYQGQQAASPRTSHSAVAPAKTTVPTVAKVPVVSSGAVETVPLKGIRKRIAEAMSHSKHTAAHFTYVEEVDMSEIVKMRTASKEEAVARGTKLTFLPFIIKALIPALKEFPYFNSSLDDERQEIQLKGDYNIGIATDTDNGLIVPVVKHADQKNIWQIAQEIQELSDKVRRGKAAIDDLRGGTFTVTNAGSLGGVLTTPVINHPEVAILGVNAIRKRPVVKGDQIVIADMMYLSISVDHRVVDGADAARFVNRLVYYLTDPKRFVFA